MFRKILVPMDGSPFSEGTLPLACELIAHGAVEVVLLHVVSHSNPYGRDPRILSDLIAHDRHEAQKYLERVAATLPHGDAQIAIEVGEGMPADRICEYAVDLRVDLILMATHGLSGLSRTLIGSVADSVVHHASVPVLLVRADAVQAVPTLHPLAQHA